jgi:hypothetical protein
MRRSAIGVIVATAIAALLFASAFVVAPRSCEGGLSFYFWLGVLALLAFLVLPFVTHVRSSLVFRSACAAGLVLAGVAVWFAGLFAANVRIICRLI